MKKKLLSILLTGAMVASMGALASVSASAVVDADGYYTPGDNVECGTNRYYFALPKSWECEFSTEAGAYWYGGTDACGAVDGSGNSYVWPGYKIHKGDYASEGYTLYYVDCPSDVPQIIFNNFVNGGTDKEAAIYLTAKQTNDAPTEFYAPEDSELYGYDFFDEMEASYNGDKAALGDYADNFFYDEVYDCGFVMNMDNMIFIAPAVANGQTFEGKPTYNGDWYFYYGNGEYGTYPTKEAAEAAGTLATLETAPVEVPTTPTNPATPTIPTSSTDPTSATKPATTDELGDNNGAIQTGEATYAVILLTLFASVSGVIVFARKKFN